MRTSLVTASLALLALGCTVEDHYCDSHAYEVADDELLPDGTTVRGILEAASAGGSVPAMWNDGDATELSATFGRATGAAMWSSGKLASKRRLGLRNPLESHHVPGGVCEDQLVVPVAVEMRTSDGLLTWVAEGEATSPAWLSAPRTLSAVMETTYDEAAFPALEDVMKGADMPPDEPEAVHVAITGFPDGTSVGDLRLLSDAAGSYDTAAVVREDYWVLSWGSDR